MDYRLTRRRKEGTRREGQGRSSGTQESCERWGLGWERVELRGLGDGGLVLGREGRLETHRN